MGVLGPFTSWGCHPAASQWSDLVRPNVAIMMAGDFIIWAPSASVRSGPHTKCVAAAARKCGNCAWLEHRLQPAMRLTVMYNDDIGWGHQLCCIIMVFDEDPEFPLILLNSTWLPLKFFFAGVCSEKDPIIILDSKQSQYRVFSILSKTHLKLLTSRIQA